ncbi:hypothetical protein ACFE04_023851 [Oxalis oulophora]
MEFRSRNYIAEEQSHALPSVRADNSHPLSTASSPIHLQQSHQDEVVHRQDNDFFDPLRAPSINETTSVEDIDEVDSDSTQVPAKDWTSFKRFLMQRFPVSKMISVSSMPDIIVKGGKAIGRASTSTHRDELDDPEKFSDESVKVITRQEYVSRLHELKDEIVQAWHAEDRVTALKLSIKVARLLMDTSVLQFYPTLFVLATDVLDMLGDMVWERIKQRAEFDEDGTKLCFLPDNFQVNDICFEAKETCMNWFCKVGSIRELLPRIYLELAILPCWQFLLGKPADVLQRLVMMTRGLGDPLASAYCRLYLAHCARKLPSCGTGHLVASVNNIKVEFMQIQSDNKTQPGKYNNRRLLVSLMEPTIEYIVKCIFMATSQSSPCVSIVLHHILKELPTEVVSSNALEILHLIKSSSDFSFDQCLNYNLLGFRLSDKTSEMHIVNLVVNNVIEVASEFDRLEEYLKIVDAYVDIILQNQMNDPLRAILDGIWKRTCNGATMNDELGSLQSILVKLLSHFKNLDDVFALNHFLEILDVIHGRSRTIVNTNILDMATRSGSICDPTTIQWLFEISQALHDDIDFVNVKDDDYQQPAHLISRFVRMVDYGSELEQHLTFLSECRQAFSSINELKETLVHSSNCLATKALKDGKKHLSFVKSCIAFSEVTIPSVTAHIRQFNLYLESAEVALLGGLVSHSDGLIDSAISCLQSMDMMDGSYTMADIDGILSSIRKLCGFLVMVPGNSELGVVCIPESILSLINSKSWMTPRMKSRVYCAVIFLSATLSQNKLPYHAGHQEAMGNDLLFFGDSSYTQDLLSLTEFVLQLLVDTIEQETSLIKFNPNHLIYLYTLIDNLNKAARGSMALEACNCIAASFKASAHLVSVCSKMIDTAKSCLNASDKYLQFTIHFLEKIQTFQVEA